MQPAYDAKGILSSFKVTTPYSFNDSGKTKKYTTIGIAAGNFFKSGIILKEPVHWVVTGQQVPIALVPTPPYHVDYIPLPWSTDKNPKLANISYIPDTTLTYKRSTSSQNKKDISSAVTSGWESKTDAAFAWSWGIPLMPADDAKYNPKISVQATGNFRHLDRTTKNLTSSAVYTKTMNLKITSGKYDSSLIYGITQHIWCYPIDPVPDWYKPASGANMGKNGKLAITATMTEAPQERTGTAYGYRARHEEGNLFSYPADIEKIPDFRKLNTQLHSGQQVHDFDSTALETSMKFENFITSCDSVTSDITNEGGFSISGMFGKADLGSTGIRASEAMQWSGQSVNKTALTRTTTKTDEIAVKFSNPTTPPSSLKQPLAGRIEDVSYRTTLQAYTNPQGVLTVGYAVDLRPDTKAGPVLWRDSVYTLSADPSFVLPKKFSFRNGAFEANTDILAATDMRGTLFYDGNDTKKEKILENETLEAGKSYIISVPVYNASFVAANNILVRLSYKKYEARAKTLTGGTKIGETTFNLGGWDKSDSNKGYADFKWTVPTNITAGQYMLIAEIDPNNTIAEIHEAWNAKIPGGNNIGYTLIMIPNVGGTKAPKNFTAKGAVEVKDEFDYYDANAIYDYAKKDSGDTEITLTATAEGDFSYTNALFEVVQYSTEYDDDGTSYDVATVLDSSYYALTPGDHIYDTTFILTEEDLISGDKIFLEITTEDNFFSIPLSGGTYNGSSSDENNDNNNGGNNNNQNDNTNNTDNPNNGGNSSDQTPNTNNTTQRLISRTFSKRYTLTRSQPVLWRIGTLSASISGSFLAAENADGLLAVEIEPATAGTIPTDKITITATTKSGVTKEGVYSIPVEVSENGETWYNADNLKFDTSDTTSDSESTTTNRITSSGGGCAGISASGLAIVLLARMMIRRKTR